MKKVLGLAIATTGFLMADMIGGELNLGYYTHIPSGTLQYQGSSIDVKDTLKWKEESDIFAKVYLEHPVPIIPNLKVGYTDFGHGGSNLLTSNFTFAGETYSVGSNVDSTFDLKMYDLALYYEILDNWVNVDVGVNVKYIDGSISANNDIGLSESTSFQVPIPMLYGKARFDVPATGLSFQVEGNYVTYDGSRFYDAEVGIRYTLALGLGLESWL